MVRKIEELSNNAWAALQSTLYDGWVLRFSEGYSKRANSIQSLYKSYEDIQKKISKCEELYSSNKLDTVFKITPEANPDNLDIVLEQLGYKKEAPTSVQIMDLDKFECSLQDNRISYDVQLIEEWVENFCRISHIDDHKRPIIQKMLNNIVPDKFFFSMKEKEKTVGCGLAVLEDDFIGLFDIVIHGECRGKGYGKLLVENILYVGKEHGAKKAYLQVVVGNEPAFKLYAGLGFTEVYEYWYRVKKV